MNHTTTLGLLLGTSLGFTASIALADVAPPSDYVEQCTVAKKQTAGKACEACKNSYQSFQEGYQDPCKSQFDAGGYTKVCQSRGASVWTEVWCRDVAVAAEDAGDANHGTGDSNTNVDDAVARTAVADCSGCRTNTKSSGGQAAAFLALGGLFTFAQRRRFKKQP